MKSSSLHSLATATTCTSGRTIANGDGLSAMLIPTCRVDKDAILGFATFQIILCRFVQHFDIGLQDRKIVSCQIAEFRLHLHIIGLSETLRNIKSVDTQSAGQVSEGMTVQQTCLVFRSSLRRALLNGKMYGEEQVLVFGPLRHLLLQKLSGGNLTQSQ